MADPSSLMAILQAFGGNSGPVTGQPSPQNVPLPSMAGVPDSAAANSSPQPAAPPSPDFPPAGGSSGGPPPGGGGGYGPPTGPQDQGQQRLQGIKGYLSNILHGFGEGVKAEVGMETDAQKQQRLFKQSQDTQKLDLEKQKTQADVQAKLAQIAQMQQSVTLPNGLTMPYGLALKVYPAYMGAKGKVDAANIGAQNKLDVMGLKALTEKGEFKSLVPSIDPSTGEPAFQMIGKDGSSMGFVPNSVVPQLMAHTSSTVQYMATDDGQIHILPKTTTSGVQLPTPAAQVATPGRIAPAPADVPSTPGAATPSAAAAPPVAAQPNHPAAKLNSIVGRVVMGTDGKPLAAKGASQSMYAFDPQSQQTVLTTKAEADAKGFIGARKVGESDIRQDTMNNNRMTDVQRKFGELQQSFTEHLQPGDERTLNYLTAHSTDLIPYLGKANSLDAINNYIKANGLSAMSPEGVRRFIALTQAHEAIVGYNRVLTGSGRSSDKALELNLAQIPLATQDNQSARSMLDAFQQNIDIASQGIPRLPGIQSPKDVKNQYQQNLNRADTAEQQRAKARDILLRGKQLRPPGATPTVPYNPNAVWNYGNSENQ